MKKKNDKKSKLKGGKKKDEVTEDKRVNKYRNNEIKKYTSLLFKIWRRKTKT